MDIANLCKCGHTKKFHFYECVFHADLYNGCSICKNGAILICDSFEQETDNFKIVEWLSKKREENKKNVSIALVSWMQNHGH